ncbi:hypothetical protein Tco_1482118 [Tanacetum coccineum]
MLPRSSITTVPAKEAETEEALILLATQSPYPIREQTKGTELKEGKSVYLLYQNTSTRTQRPKTDSDRVICRLWKGFNLPLDIRLGVCSPDKPTPKPSSENTLPNSHSRLTKRSVQNSTPEAY